MTTPDPSPSATAGLAAIASSVFPGLGHLLTNRRKLGVALIVIDVLAVLATLVVWIWYPVTALKAWVTPWALTMIIVGNLLVLVYRAAVTADSFFRVGGRRWYDWIAALVAVSLVLFPHLLIGSLAATQSDLITTVFAGSEPVAPPPPSVTTTSTSPAAVAGEPVATNATSTTTTTTTAPPRIWGGYERLNILLLGSDAGVGRTGTRTDTIILVSIEPESGDVAMFSVPRNLTEAPLPEGMGIWDCDCFPDIITHLWANGEWYPDAFPGPQSPSVNALKAAIGLVFDVDVHYYAKVDLEGFVGIVDALGGVDIDVPKTIVDETYPHEDGGTEYVVIEEGPQHLDGHLALAYARIRRHSGDFARMHRQRCVLGALADQANVVNLITGYGAIAEAVKAHVETDIPIDRLDDLVELIPKLDTERFGSLRITSYNYGRSGHAGYQIYDLDAIRDDAHELMADPTVQLETQDGLGFDATCDESFD